MYLLIFIMLVITFPLFSGVFPLPGRDNNNSLVLLIVEKDESVLLSGNISRINLEGQKQSEIKFGKKLWEVRYFRLASGHYNIVLPETVTMSGIRSGSPFVVSDNSIILLPVKAVVFQSSDGSVFTRIESINEEDRQKAAEDLVSYMDFTSWFGRDFIGFGSIKPSLDGKQNQHQLILNSDPSGAGIYLDDTYVGLTPQKFFIDESKHQLRFKLDSHIDDIRYISVMRSVEINVSMETTESLEDKVYYRTLITPFYSVIGEADQMSGLLADTLVPVLGEDPRLELITGNIDWKNFADIIQPDFNSSELSDIDLIASGLYIRGETDLTVLASLYDVRSETIKAGISWTGPIGLNIFDAVDEISLAFLEEVDKVLPEAGKVLIKRNSTVYSGLSSIDARIETKRLIEIRNKKRNTLMVTSGLSGVFISLEALDDGAPSSKDISTTDGPPFIPLVIDYERYKSEYFSIGGGMEYVTPSLVVNTGSDGDLIYAPSVFSLSANGRIVVRGVKSDLIIGIGPVFRFIPKETVIWEDGGTWEDTVGPVFAVGLEWRAGFRLYLNKRITERPYFLFFGFTDTFPQIYFEPDGSNYGLNSSAIDIFCGGGVMF